MKVYIASKYEERNRAKNLMKKLEALGHTITHDWTNESDEGMTRLTRPDYHRFCATKDWSGVRAADCLIILPHPEGKGIFVEMGVAIERWIPVIIADDGESNMSIFASLENVFRACGETGAIELLERIKR